MSRQADITDKMRAILIDWLVQVHFVLRLRTKTLYLTISIMDRYLTKQSINRSKLQLLGVTSLLIASKQEEIIPPTLAQMANHTDSAFTIAEIREMEKIVLNVLNFEIMKPTPFEFYEIICKILGINSREYFYGRYLMESFMIDYNYTFYPSSLIACTAVYGVLKYFKFKNYGIIRSDFFNSNNNCKPEKLKECARNIYYFIDIIGKSNLIAVKNKFGNADMFKVSILNFDN
jgi:hypothetical protein